MTLWIRFPSMALKNCIFYLFRTDCWIRMANLYILTRNVKFRIGRDGLILEQQLPDSEEEIVVALNDCLKNKATLTLKYYMLSWLQWQIQCYLLFLNCATGAMWLMTRMERLLKILLFRQSSTVSIVTKNVIPKHLQ